MSKTPKIDTQKALKMATAGTAISDIAKHFSVTVSSVSQALKKVGYSRNRNRQNMPDDVTPVPTIPPLGAAPDGKIYNMDDELEMLSKPHGKGYRVSIVIKGKRKFFSAARLVCEAYHGPAPAGHVATHKDGNKSNLAAENLMWALPRTVMNDREFVQLWQSCTSNAEAIDLIGDFAYSRAKSLRNRGVRLKDFGVRSSTQDLNDLIDEVEKEEE